MKSVLLFVIDALASRVVVPALQRGQLPHMAELIARGTLAEESVAVFPSITPAATASLVTGCYPSDHGIAGAHWYDEQKDEIAYYGDDFWVILQKGFGRFFNDFLVRLNGDRLKRATAFEIVEKHNRKAGCVNYLWFRGESEHEVHTPFLLRLVPGIPGVKSIPGPHLLCLGDFVAEEVDEPSQDVSELASSDAGLAHRYGFDDSKSAEYLLQLARTGFPDFTLVYFPDNDFESHRVGPRAALPVLEAFDENLGKLFDVFGGCDSLLERMAVVITGDHSQSDMVDDKKEARIALDELLSEYTIAKAGSAWRAADQLMICPNMRAAQLYLRHDVDLDRRRLVETILSDQRVDHAIWLQSKSGVSEFHVATSDRGVLRFHRGDQGENSATDLYGTTWSWDGELAAVDAQCTDDGQLRFGDYPNAFERIVGAFGKESGNLWLSARPGYEFGLPRTEVHPGGSHGSLHAVDSLSPLIVAGAPQGIEVPPHPRSIDVLPLCLKLLGIERPSSVGATSDPWSHAR
mgnify:CR=1 FL=1